MEGVRHVVRQAEGLTSVCEPQSEVEMRGGSEKGRIQKRKIDKGESQRGANG